MGKSTLAIIVAASAAILLLVIAATQSHGYDQPHPYTAAAWVSAMLAFGVFVVMLAEYSLHGRVTHICLGVPFLAAGIMGVWEALTLQSAMEAGQLQHKYLSLWKWEWVTLALMLISGLLVHHKLWHKKRSTLSGLMSVSAVLWAAVAVFSTSMFPAVSKFLSDGRSGMLVSLACGLIFAIGCLVYSRPMINRGNAVLGWMAYGFIFAAFAQFAAAQRVPSQNLLYGFASLMKVLAYLSPLAGMLAEHARLQVRLKDQSSEVVTLVQAQQALASAKSPNELYQRMADLISHEFPSALVGLFIFDRDHGLLKMEANIGFDEDIVRQLVFRPSEGPAGDSFSEKKTVLVRDVLKEPNLSQKLEGVKGITSAVFVPLLASEEKMGVLALFFGVQHIRLQKDEHRLLDALAGQAALAAQWTMTYDRLQGHRH